MTEIRMGLIGAGVIGRRHIKAMQAVPAMKLVAIADPAETSAGLAAEQGASHWPDASAMLAGETLDAVIIATPTDRHHEDAIACLDAGLALLIEKPVTATLDQADAIVSRAEAAGLVVLVGHQRRYYPAVAEARRLIDSGRIGRLMGVSGVWMTRKHDAYFSPPWRHRVAAGPVLTNLIHEIDLLRFLCGEITMVSAMVSHADMKLEKEDIAAMVLGFANGAVGNFLLSDRTPSPWGWEFATGENAAFPRSGQNAVRFFGTDAALDFPNLELWQHDRPAKTAVAVEEGGGNWQMPLSKTVRDTPMIDAYIAQLEHLAAVLRGSEAPLITAADARASLAATLAVLTSATTGRHETPG